MYCTDILNTAISVAVPCAKMVNTIGADTVEGPVRGLIDDGLAVFRGVPFAAAPTGLLRFQAPIEPQRRVDTLDTVSSSPMCPQNLYVLRPWALSKQTKMKTA